MGRFRLEAEGPPCPLGTPSVVLGTSRRGCTETWEPCAAGGQQGCGSGTTISHTRSLASGEDLQGWRRARVAVPSGSSFPRNPLGATLGIPGNTVLEATARRLEMVHPMGSHSLWKSW